VAHLLAAVRRRIIRLVRRHGIDLEPHQKLGDVRLGYSARAPRTARAAAPSSNRFFRARTST
jgi:hypothetical protein